LYCKDNKILATGYNGFPRGCSDDAYCWAKDVDKEVNEREKRFNNRLSRNKFWYVIHAELNAILNCNRTDLDNSIIYVDLFPCNECAKTIIQAGIKEVVYMSDEDIHKESYKVSKLMLDDANVKIRKIERTEFLIKLMEV